MVITAKGANASYLDLYWLCKYEDGGGKPNWWRLLFGNLRHMQGLSKEKSVDGPWFPGMPTKGRTPLTDEEEARYRAWRTERKAACITTPICSPRSKPKSSQMPFVTCTRECMRRTMDVRTDCARGTSH